MTQFQVEEGARLSKAARLCALAVAVVATATLLLRLYLAVSQTGSLPAALGDLSQYFTILTNTLVMLAMYLIALGVTPATPVMLALVAAITGVGFAYHLLLAHLWAPEGLVWLADQGVHTAVPVLSVLWWIGLAEKAGHRWGHAALAMIWPLAYCLYALVRAQFSGFYPYPFIDLPTLGLSRLAFNIVGLSLGFFVLGLAFVAIARRASR
jgi:hypothetical protein